MEKSIKLEIGLVAMTFVDMVLSFMVMPISPLAGTIGFALTLANVALNGN